MTTRATLDAATADLRQAIATAKGGRRNGHVPRDLRKRALELLEAGRARGTKRRETAAALGIHETTLMSWQREKGSGEGFVQARVVTDREAARRSTPAPAAPARTLRMVVIDGLDASTLAALLGRIA